MSTRYDGGPAFPHHPGHHESGRGAVTLRDYFAIRAPEPSEIAIDAQRAIDRRRDPHNDRNLIRNDEEIRVFLRYRFADAMLKERAK